MRTRSPLAILMLALAVAPAACSIKRVIFLSDDAGTSSTTDAGIDAGPGDTGIDTGDARADAPADRVDATTIDATDAGAQDAIATVDAIDGTVEVDGGAPDGCSGANCEPVCGDNIVEPGEQCDDGNTTDGDTCESDCTLPRCGNNILDLRNNEQCDFGTETARCNANCTVARCGDGILNRPAGETCDDGNTIDGDGCDAKCQITSCADMDQVPPMTSPTAPSGIVDRSGAYDSNNEAWQAFDANNATMWMSALNDMPAWISYEWTDSPHGVTSYAITAGNDALLGAAPRDWTFEGWDDAMAIWFVLDSRSGETDWGGQQRRVYTVATPGFFTKYRLAITDDNDAMPGVLMIAISSIDLMGCPP